MVTISVENEEIVINVLGWHKLWAFKRELRFQSKNIISVYQNEEEIKRVKGIRIPGTHLPYVITAGTFITFGGKKEFWDVCNKNNALIINLQNEKYNRLVVEVENPFLELEKLKKLQH